MKLSRLIWVAALGLWLAGLALFASGDPAGSIVWGCGIAAFLAIALAVWLRARRDAARYGRDKPSLLEAVLSSL